MKVLVIPDVHLKTRIFHRAMSLMKQGIAERAVCLMDIADDWDRGMRIGLYEECFDAAIAFAREYPDTLWCYGNHDLSYIWTMNETGYSPFAQRTVQKKLAELNRALPADNPIKYVQRIDNVLFSHGGVLEYFVEKNVPLSRQDDIDVTIETINSLGCYEMWRDESPIWCRPQEGSSKLYKDESFIQVVGHTPVAKIFREGSVISCDVFSTYRSGEPIGNEEYLLIDTVTHEFKGVK